MTLDYVLVIVDKQSNLIALLLFPAAVFDQIRRPKKIIPDISVQPAILVGHRNHKFLHAAKQGSDSYAANEEFQKLHRYCYRSLDHVIKHFGRLAD